MNQVNQNQQDKNMWAMFCHLSAFAGYIVPLGSILGPLIIWSIKKDQYPAIDDHGKEALNFNISIAIYMIIAAILIVIVVGIFMLIALWVFQTVMIIMASIKANNGEFFKYPLTIQFIK
ncbi:MAG: DUF4870 domain-containing protein [Deltaproteobacteria bacterium]|nr:MAG: DUF4870 domain-containing protein [Deltaproteobacteria bacterium]